MGTIWAMNMVMFLIIAIGIGIGVHMSKREKQIQATEVYRLDHDESVLYKTKKLHIGGVRYERMNNDAELIVTNKRLIWTYITGSFGNKRKECEIFKYSDIKKVNDEINIRIDEVEELDATVIYFNFTSGDPEFYRSGDDGTDEDEVYDVLNAVRKAFGLPEQKQTQAKNSKAIPGSKTIATIFRDTRNVFRSVFKEGEEEPEPEIKTISCPGCGNQMVVTKGVIKVCEYCGTKITL